MSGTLNPTKFMIEPELTPGKEKLSDNQSFSVIFAFLNVGRRFPQGRRGESDPLFSVLEKGGESFGYHIGSKPESCRKTCVY